MPRLSSASLEPLAREAASHSPASIGMLQPPRVTSRDMPNIALIRTSTAKRLARALDELSRADADYWSYKRMAQRPGLHGIIRYPAMMVPRMQSDVLNAAMTVVPNLNRVLDPFVGSGTTLVETVRRGVEFEGVDINPLAILICRAKLLDLSPRTVSLRADGLVDRLTADRSNRVEVNFFGRDKWFTRQASIDLSRIRRSIAAEPNKQLRQFFWVVLSEVIRQTSLSRETTYKLHIRPEESRSLIKRPLECFNDLLADACTRYAQDNNGTAIAPRSAKSLATLHCHDVRTLPDLGGASAQLLLTSPPYGDNESTIPYGQFSYLALNWILQEDLEGDRALHATAYATDTASLGGSIKGYMDRAVTMAAVLPSFDTFFEALSSQGRPGLEGKVAAFTADLFDAVGASLSRLDRGGIAVWTLGDRTIGGLKVPMVRICREINEFFGMSPVAEITRRIQSKRMPHRNSVGATMVSESLVVMVKP